MDLDFRKGNGVASFLEGNRTSAEREEPPKVKSHDLGKQNGSNNYKIESQKAESSLLK